MQPLKRSAHIMLFFAVLFWGGFFRFYGQNWDQGKHLHPDERFLTMVTNDISWPTTFEQYFDTHTSPLNPHNKNYSFYVYGTWPIILTKAIAQFFSMDSYDKLTIVGRTLSALFDMITLIVVMATTRMLVKQNGVALFAGFVYGTFVLPIQLSHFYTVDSFATLCVSLALYFLVTNQLGARLAIFTGLAIAAKISTVFLLIPIVLSYVFQFPWHGSTTAVWKNRLKAVLHGCGVLLLIAIVIRISFPYLFDGVITLNTNVLANWKELASYDGPKTHFPPALQWIGTTPFFLMINTALFGMGGIQTLLFISILLPFVHALIHKKLPRHAQLLLWWILIIGIYQSTRFAKPLRYLVSIYPSLAVITGIGAHILFDRIKRSHYKRFIKSLWMTLFLFLLVWPVMVMHIYATPHSRVAASTWIYSHISSDKIIAWEHWDDPLPLLIDGHRGGEYTTIQLALYDQDSINKWKKLSTDLSNTDYLVLSSNRVYGGIGQAAIRYPKSVQYYALLFNGDLGFTLVKEFVSRPSLPFLVPICINPYPIVSYSALIHTKTTCIGKNIELIDDFAEESFTVYDHPKVLIFANTKHLSQEELFSLITKNTQ